jgi:hypothetical protein
MSDQAILAIIAAVALAFEVQAVQNLLPVVWPSFEVQAVPLCTDVDLNTGCGIAVASASRLSE